MKNISVKMGNFFPSITVSKIVSLHLDEFGKNKQLQGLVLCTQKYFSNTVNAKLQFFFFHWLKVATLETVRRQKRVQR